MNVTARVMRSKAWWAIEVPEVPGAFSQARRLDQVSEAAADAVGLMLAIDPATVEVTVEPVLSAEDEALIRQAIASAATAHTAQREAATAMRTAVHALRAALPVRDVAQLLHISHQRVSQLCSGTRHPAGPDHQLS